jgi:hypothetical protein
MQNILVIGFDRQRTVNQQRTSIYFKVKKKVITKFRTLQNMCVVIGRGKKES